jgi:hypothetical protein
VNGATWSAYFEWPQRIFCLRENMARWELSMLTPGELLRNKREREFQARILAAVDKPKQSHIITIINSPFVLWALSAILVSATAAYLTASIGCTAEAERLLETHDKITSELAGRYRQMRRGILAAKSFEEALNFVDELPSKSSKEFSNRSTSSLWAQARRIEQKSYETNKPVDPDTRILDRWEHLNDIFLSDKPASQMLLSYGGIEHMQELARDDEVARMQDKAHSFYLEPDCSQWQIVLRMIGFSPAILRMSWYGPVRPLEPRP